MTDRARALDTAAAYARRFLDGVDERPVAAEVDAGAIRASVGVGTTGADVVRLVEAVRSYVEHGPATRYEVVDGCWAVADDPRPVPAGSGLEGLFATAAAGFLADAAGCGPAA